MGVRVCQLPHRRVLRLSSGSLCSAQVLHEPLPLRWRELADTLLEPMDRLLRIIPPQPVPVLVQVLQVVLLLLVTQKFLLVELLSESFFGSIALSTTLTLGLGALTLKSILRSEGTDPPSSPSEAQGVR